VEKKLEAFQIFLSRPSCTESKGRFSQDRFFAHNTISAFWKSKERKCSLQKKLSIYRIYLYSITFFMLSEEHRLITGSENKNMIYLFFFSQGTRDTSFFVFMRNFPSAEKGKKEKKTQILDSIHSILVMSFFFLSVCVNVCVCVCVCVCMLFCVLVLSANN